MSGLKWKAAKVQALPQASHLFATVVLLYVFSSCTLKGAKRLGACTRKTSAGNGN
ncbi:hypothetical protein [Sporosarcina sp. USHLN248]|uniref:hypothetical protein n=1 Tax=Sporosarcina sp. USHLN248 TaxID=3081300 RepID=UPI0030171DB4